MSKIKYIYRLFVLVFFFLGGQSIARAQRVSDSITVSLLTCSPGELVYEIYGHTALRVVDHTLATDMVFNYGVFDFSQPHFLWRFMMGQTDYMVQPIPYFIFEEEYVERGSGIVSQQLNLTKAEANDLYNKLLQNAKPENRTYRYNFLTNNCTTKVRDMIESSIKGHVQYKEQAKKTYRESLHEFTTESPWAELGDDVMLGAATDTILSDRAAQFLPSHLQSYFADAIIYDEQGNARPMVVGGTLQLLKEQSVSKPAAFPLSPLACSLILLGIMLLILGLEYLVRRNFWVFDMLFMPGVGALGTIISMMALFSEHPTLSSNWQIWVFNPLPLLCMPWVVWCAIKRRRCPYHYFNLVILSIFLVATPWLPQQFCSIILPLVLSLLTRPVSYIINFDRLVPKKTAKKSRK